MELIHWKNVQIGAFLLIITNLSSTPLFLFNQVFLLIPILIISPFLPQPSFLPSLGSAFLTVLWVSTHFNPSPPWCFRLLLYCNCSSPGISYFYKDPGFFFKWEIILEITFCVLGSISGLVIVSRLFQWTELWDLFVKVKYILSSYWNF